MSQAANTRPLPEAPLSLEEAAERRAKFLQFVQQHMKLGEDYGPVRGQSDRFTLYKPGAEKVCAHFGLSPRADVTHRVEEWEPSPKGKPFVAYEVKVTLINKRTGVIEGEGLGSCNSRERQYKNQEAAFVANTILKMAKKRALSDATTGVTASSGMFASGDPGEDIEDPQAESYQQPRRDNRGTPPQQPRPQAPRPPQAPRQQPPAQPAPQPAAQLLVTQAKLNQYNELRNRAVSLGLQVPGTLSLNSTMGKWNTRMEMVRAVLAGAGDPEAALLAAADQEPAGGARYKIPRGTQPTQCKSCQAQIYFVPSGRGGGVMPVDGDGTPHFATCPNADVHRKNKREQQAPAAPRPARNSSLPRHVERLWAVIGEYGLPPAKDGQERNDRLDTCNQILMDHQMEPVDSFNKLSVPQSQVLVQAIQGGLLREWNWKAVAA